MRLSWVVALVLLPGLLPGAADAQSLGEAARKERERRKRLEDSGVKPRELSDKDLRSGKDRPAADPASGTTGEAGPASSQPSSGDAEDDSRRRAETGWRQRVAKARARAEVARKAYEYLNGLSLNAGESYVNDEGKPVIRSLEELRSTIAKAKAEWEAADKAVENILETARRDNVPPGWLR